MARTWDSTVSLLFDPVFLIFNCIIQTYVRGDVPPSVCGHNFFPLSFLIPYSLFSTFNVTTYARQAYAVSNFLSRKINHNKQTRNVSDLRFCTVSTYKFACFYVVCVLPFFATCALLQVWGVYCV